MKRPEAWHDTYKMFVAQFGCILSVPQAATVAGVSARQVTQRFPDGWIGATKGRRIRLDTLLDQIFECY